MSWFKNWPIGIKIALAFGAMAVTVIITAIFQITAINRLEQSFSGLIDTDIQRIATIQDVSLANEQLRTSVNRYLIQGLKPADKTDAEMRTEHLKDTFETYEAVQSSPGRVANLKDMVSQVEGDAKAATDVTQQGEAAMNARTTFNESQEALSNTLESTTTNEKDVITRANQHINKQVDGLFGSVVAVAVLAALLALLLGVLVTWWLSRAVTRVRQGAARFADGDLSQSIPVTSKDEFGQLSETFNVMARRLQESYRRKAQSSTNPKR